MNSIELLGTIDDKSVMYLHFSILSVFNFFKSIIALIFSSLLHEYRFNSINFLNLFMQDKSVIFFNRTKFILRMLFNSDNPFKDLEDASHNVIFPN